MTQRGGASRANAAASFAQIAKNLGQTLRAFQPTIKELQQVSQDFKSALDQEVRAGCCAAPRVLQLTQRMAHCRLDLTSPSPLPW